MSFQCFLEAIVFSAELVFILVRRPYKNRNWRPILNMVITIAIMAIYYLMNTMEGVIQDYGPLAVLVLLLVCFIYSTVILVIEIRQSLS